MKRILLILAVVGLSCIAAWGLFWREKGPASANPPEQLYAAGDLSATLAALDAVPLDTLTEEQRQQWLTLEAGCYRQLSRLDALRDWLGEARESGLSEQQVALQKELTDIQLGMSDESPMRLLRDLEKRGARLDDARFAVARGALARADYSSAERVLEDWEAEFPEAPQPAFLRGVMAQLASQWKRAEQRLLQAVDRNPRFELAYLALAEFYAAPPNANLTKRAFVLERLVEEFPANQEATVLLAGAQRRMGELSAARQIIERSRPRGELQTLALAELELDSGHYEQAAQLLSEAGLVEPDDFRRMTDAAFSLGLQGQGNSSQVLTQRVNWAAVALGLSGRRATALQIFDVALDRVARGRRYADLQVKWSLQPNKQTLADQMNAMLSPAYTPGYPTLAETEGGHVPPANESPGELLYRQHCQVCHGSTGDGFGPAARHLFPLPRNFREEPMRLVSAENRLATDADLARTIRLGLVGASMPAFQQLSDEQLALLVKQVRIRQRQGLVEQYRFRARDLELDTDVSQAKEAAWVEERLVPSEVLALPDDWQSPEDADKGAVKKLSEQGALVFRQVGCLQCHSVQADQPTSAAPLFDTLGRPLVARRLGQEPYRGGTELEDVYRRIRLGIPGTPHPALANVSNAQLRALVQFVSQLGEQAKASQGHSLSTNYGRRYQAAGS